MKVTLAERASISWKIIVWNSIANAEHSTNSFFSRSSFDFFSCASQQRTLTFYILRSASVHSPQRLINLSKSRGKFTRKIFAICFAMRFSHRQMRLNCVDNNFPLIHGSFGEEISPRLTRLSSERGSAKSISTLHDATAFLERFLHNLISLAIAHSRRERERWQWQRIFKLPKIFIGMFTRFGEMYFEKLFSFEKVFFSLQEITSCGVAMGEFCDLFIYS